MNKNTEVIQFSIFDDREKILYYEELINRFSGQFEKYICPESKHSFGFWMQTLADVDLLILELEGLAEEYRIDIKNKSVELTGDFDFIRRRIAHLEKVDGINTLYTDFIDTFQDTNAYAFHNLYPYKGKFYPRVVRTLINAFGLNENHIILDPFNGSGTTTHEASLMGIKSIGIDVTPIGILIAKLKNELLFIEPQLLDFSEEELREIFNQIKEKKWEHENEIITKLLQIIYFDTMDAFARTSRYNKRGPETLFIEKFNYVKNCYKLLNEVKNRWELNFVSADVINEDVLNLNCKKGFENYFDAIITSPPYYFSIDYVGKDKIAYDYWGIDMKEIESKYLGMKNNLPKKRYGSIPAKVILYYEDLKRSIENMYWALKPGGKIAIIVGDSSVNGKKIPTTLMTKYFCEEVGFKFQQLVFNPLLGARNRAIRGESIIICQK